MGGFKSSNFNSRAVNFDTMKLIYCVEAPKSLVAEGFSNIEKARWFRIKTIVLIWSKCGDSNSRPPVPETGALPTALHLEIIVYFCFAMTLCSFFRAPLRAERAVT